MNFLFVAPKYVNRGQKYEFYFGLAYVSSYMKHKGYNVFCLNPNHYDIPLEQQLSEYINKNQIDVICTGGMSIHFNQINKVLDAAKKIKPEIITVAGGAIITSDPGLALENMQIDFGIIGEGEETMADLADALCNGRDVNNVRGVTYFDSKNDLILTEKRDPIHDLDKLPILDYEGFEYDYFVSLFSPADLYHFTILDEVRPAYLSTSRSCPFSCTFCYHPLGNKYRQRTLDNVFKEIDYLVEMYNVNLLIILDDLFSVDKIRMYEFAERIKKYNINWSPQLRVADVDDKVLKTLKDSGVFAISYGIESVSDKILKSMRKRTTKVQIENALKLTRDAKIAIIGNIIIGDPEETEETAKESIDWWKSHPEYGINLSMIYTIPDSPIYRYAIANGLIADKLEHMKNNFPIVNLTKISNKKFEEIQGFVYTCQREDKYLTVGKVTNSKIESKNPDKGNVFKIEIKCPICHNISEYKNMHQTSFNIHFLVICRNCFTRLRVNTRECYPENYTLYNKIMVGTIKMGYNCVRKYTVIRYIYNLVSPLLRSQKKLYEFIASAMD